ncbi:hypothetical protein Lesp01_08290 [Lentzea sp. NBRC 102530]|nr:hypothetical protein Lesp01_08290 [Lentzea sp. NBRC 102530]
MIFDGVLSVRTSCTTWLTVRTSVSLRRSAQVLRSAGLFGFDHSALLAGSWRHDSSVRTSLPAWDSGVGGVMAGGAPTFGMSLRVPSGFAFGAGGAIGGAGGGAGRASPFCRASWTSWVKFRRPSRWLTSWPPARACSICWSRCACTVAMSASLNWRQP